MRRSIEETARGLGDDGAAWRRVFERLGTCSTSCSRTCFGPFLHVPRHPLRLVHFGTPRSRAGHGSGARLELAAGPRALRRGRGPRASARSRPMSSSVGMALISACHALRLAGGEGRIARDRRCPGRRVREHGGTIETERRRASRELPSSRRRRLRPGPGGRSRRSPATVCPPRVARAYRRYRHGPGAFKVDLAVEGGVPWLNEACRRGRDRPRRRHVRGDRRRRARHQPRADARAPVRPGRAAVPRRPGALQRGRAPGLVLCARSPRLHGDAEEALVGQIERFAPGIPGADRREAVRSPAELEAENANYVGGRHHHRRQHARPGADPPAPRARSLQHRDQASSSARRPRRPAPAPTG